LGCEPYVGVIADSLDVFYRRIYAEELYWWENELKLKKRRESKIPFLFYSVSFFIFKNEFFILSFYKIKNLY
jgi:hypothetical protein